MIYPEVFVKNVLYWL